MKKDGFRFKLLLTYTRENQQLRQTVQAIATVTPKIDPKNLVSEENSEKQDSFWGLNDS